MDIKPIETSYRGYRFRSRLEARWAVFFDAMKIAWEYEREGVKVSSISENKEWLWLPDFYLPATKTHVEVKGDWNEVPLDYWSMIINSIDWGGPFADGAQSVLLLGGIPDPPIMYVSDRLPTFPLLRWNKGVGLYQSSFNAGGLLALDEHGDVEWFDSSWGDDEGFRNGVMREFRTATKWQADAAMEKAIRAARGARFEHGEQPCL